MKAFLIITTLFIIWLMHKRNKNSVAIQVTQSSQLDLKTLQLNHRHEIGSLMELMSGKKMVHVRLIIINFFLKILF